MTADRWHVKEFTQNGKRIMDITSDVLRCEPKSIILSEKWNGEITKMCATKPIQHLFTASKQIKMFIVCNNFVCSRNASTALPWNGC